MRAINTAIWSIYSDTPRYDDAVTSSFRDSRGWTLDEVAGADFRSDARTRLEAILAGDEYSDMSDADREALIDETIDHLTQRPRLTANQFEEVAEIDDGTYKVFEPGEAGEAGEYTVSQESAQLYRKLDREHDNLLRSPSASVASDVFGGITHLKIDNDARYGHRDPGYWFDSNGDPERTVEKELFADAMGWRVMAAQHGDTSGIDATSTYLPGSAVFVDEIVDKMSDSG